MINKAMKEDPTAVRAATLADIIVIVFKIPITPNDLYPRLSERRNPATINKAIYCFMRRERLPPPPY